VSAPGRRGKGVYLLSFFFALVVVGAQTGRASSYDLSADTLMTENGEAPQEGKIYIKGDKYRIQRKGEAEYIVLRHDKGIMWVVMPKEKVYVELPLDPNRTPKIQETNPGEISRKYVGSEEVDGHPTDKYEITVKEGSKTESFYQWTATDINFPIKTAGLKDEWSVEFRNIRKTVPDNLFEIPEGYQKAKAVIKPTPEAGQKPRQGQEGGLPASNRLPR
jgi:hypothetical protein